MKVELLEVSIQSDMLSVSSALCGHLEHRFCNRDFMLP